LGTRSSDTFQLGTYGVGGSIDDHLDTYGKPDEPQEMSIDFDTGKTMIFSKLNPKNVFFDTNISDSWWHGDRLFSALFYLSPTLGGSTYFPRAGLTIPVVPRAILLWQNLDFATSNPLKIMEHGACPVLKGEKWIANKWVRYFDQMFQYPCTKSH
jgi:hypothetical protein